MWIMLTNLRIVPGFKGLNISAEAIFALVTILTAIYMALIHFLWYGA